MHKQLSSYVKVYKGWLDSAKCEDTVIELESVDWTEHYFYRSSDKHKISRNDKELDISHSVIFNKPYIMECHWRAYKKYCDELNFSWFDGWNAFSNVRFNRYHEGASMAIHCDHIHSLFEHGQSGVPILTCLSLLNENYEGGEFIMWEDTIIDLDIGDTIVFPSNFLYPHSVKCVTAGTRYSAVSWAW